MKSVRDYIAQDMWGHILMTGPDIRGYLSGEKYPTVAEKKGYCQGIFTMYPHMMLGNFTRWLWEDGAPKPYEDFMSSSVEALSSKVQPVLEQCFTEKYGTYQCVLKAREALTRLCGRTVPDVTIEQVMREGTADVAPEYVQVIREAAADYAAEIMRKLREHEYDPKTMRLWIVGGGGCLIRNFGQYDPNRVTIIGDIHASAKGYEYLAERRLQREARAR